jgi:hypothetical protein
MHMTTTVYDTAHYPRPAWTGAYLAFLGLIPEEESRHTGKKEAVRTED